MSPSAIQVSTGAPLIACNGLRKEYRMGSEVVHALDGVSFNIGEGELISIMGASGSGKSTLMNMLGVLDTPTSGGLHIEGNDIAKMNRDDLARLRNHTLGFVFQNFNLLPRTSAVENVKLPLMYGNLHGFNADERAKECLELVGLGDRMDHHPNQLSGGQQQRVAIARALVNGPRIILADEPTGALDYKTGKEILQLFRKLNESGITMIIVTHDQEVGEFCDRQLVFRDGKLLSDSNNLQSMGAAE
ncbi:ABC transporter ATP-binding protein [Kordiimonas laminariae]|uniref:ABC transporter ATP-binding protein n=1 Tax=Kordiimonas laminariae TaxID=2917717 RepID=UPI001FF57E32|nr:ABC transporter ATP-binding protein [Kordiimonas laminariae]MCK0070652.1 ABC transporter ATP-binding protein [Kordiimonas laminariae]